MERASGDHPAERAADVVAAAVFAVAVAFAAGAAGLNAAIAIIAGTAASVLAFIALRNVAPEPRSFALPEFELAPVEPIAGPEEGELLLEDPLGNVTGDDRVVRLFGPGRAAPAGEAGAEQPDASQALSEALAELRRLLR